MTLKAMRLESKQPYRSRSEWPRTRCAITKRIT